MPSLPVSRGASRTRSLAPSFFSKGTLAILVAALFAWSPAWSAGLGRLNVRSALGQPLDAEVEVPVADHDEAASLQVRLEPASAFKQANLEYNPALTQLRFEIQARADGSNFVHITSVQAVNEPYLDLLLELTWANGRVVREYTVLLDPPSLRQPQAEPIAPVASTPAPAVAPAAPAAAPAPAPAAAPDSFAPPPSAAPAPAAAPAAAKAAAPAQAAPVSRATPAPAPAPAAPAAAAPQSVRVHSGDTASGIASAHREEGISLDQMLIAMLRANPNAFVDGNVNRLVAGRDLSIPDRDAASQVESQEASREVAAQSADFAAYRSRLAQSVAGASPEPAAEHNAATGKVTPRVEDHGAAPNKGDSVKIATGGAGQGKGAAAAAAARDEQVARERAEKDARARIEELQRTNDKIRKANEVAQQQAADAQKRAEDLRAKKEADERARREADQKAEQERVAKAKADKDAADAAAAAAARAKAEAQKATDAAKAAATPAPAPAAAPASPAKPAKPLPPKAAPKPEPSAMDAVIEQLTSPVGLGALGGALALGLLGLQLARRKRSGKGAGGTDTEMGANSLFGATGGQSVDTASASTFNSSFIPAASQLDSNEVDPVAEADVYIAYGREEQAEDILKEALRLQPDRHPVRVKLLEIYARRGDKASFVELAQELHQRTGGVGDDWERAARLGASLDPSNPLFASAAHADPGAIAAAPGAPAQGSPTAGDPHSESPLEFEPLSTTGLGPTETLADTQHNFDLEPSGTTSAPSTLSGAETFMPPDTVGGSGQGPAKVSPVAPAPTPASDPHEITFEGLTPAASPTPAAEGPRTTPAIPALDFGSLDFDLGPTRTDETQASPTPAATGAAPAAAPDEIHIEAAPPPPPETVLQVEPEPPTIPALDLLFEVPAGDPKVPPAPPTLTGSVPIPKLDLELAPGTPAKPAVQGRPQIGSLEESLSRPTLVGDVGALTEDLMPKLSSNTDQATVPLIDFDLSGADTALGGRKAETAAGSPLASQMATKLDLARGYIDLGVKDGARELLEEVMKDGTREQRAQAVELIKLIES